MAENSVDLPQAVEGLIRRLIDTHSPYCAMLDPQRVRDCDCEFPLRREAADLIERLARENAEKDAEIARLKDVAHADRTKLFAELRAAQDCEAVLRRALEECKQIVESLASITKNEIYSDYHTHIKMLAICNDALSASAPADPMRELAKEAVPIVQEYVRQNPRAEWRESGKMNDSMGAHDWLAKARAVWLIDK